MMQYILIRADDGRELLQEVFGGYVIRHCSLGGQTVDAPQGATVVDAGFTAPAWAKDVPVPTTAPIQETDRRITNLAFLNRFKDEEAIRIDLASIGATVEAASIRRYQSKVNAAEWVDLNLEETRRGVIGLEMVGFLAPGRASEILDAPINDSERPVR